MQHGKLLEQAPNAAFAVLAQSGNYADDKQEFGFRINVFFHSQVVVKDTSCSNAGHALCRTYLFRSLPLQYCHLGRASCNTGCCNGLQ
jgi:hypothetical protein